MHISVIFIYIIWRRPRETVNQFIVFDITNTYVIFCYIVITYAYGVLKLGAVVRVHLCYY